MGILTCLGLNVINLCIFYRCSFLLHCYPYSIDKVIRMSFY